MWEAGPKVLPDAAMVRRFFGLSFVTARQVRANPFPVFEAGRNSAI